jgi:hypothetical protein
MLRRSHFRWKCDKIRVTLHSDFSPYRTELLRLTLDEVAGKLSGGFGNLQCRLSLWHFNADIVQWEVGPPHLLSSPACRVACVACSPSTHFTCTRAVHRRMLVLMLPTACSC